jgi:hypothetical protein
MYSGHPTEVESPLITPNYPLITVASNQQESSFTCRRVTEGSVQYSELERRSPSEGGGKRLERERTQNYMDNSSQGRQREGWSSGRFHNELTNALSTKYF